MFAVKKMENRFIPQLVCSKCRKIIEAGNGMVIWNDKMEVKTICKGTCDDENFKFGITLEQFLYDVVINSKIGIIKKPKRWSLE